MNAWTLLFAVLAFASATALAVVARRCAALQRGAAALAAELEAANEQLEIFTGAMSDELQAPLRELHRIGRQAMHLEWVDMELLARGVVDELLPRYPKSKASIAELPAVRGDKALL